MHYHYAITIVNYTNPWGSPPPTNGRGLQPLVGCFFTTCSSFHSFYGKSSFIFMCSSSFLQFTTIISFFSIFLRSSSLLQFTTHIHFLFFFLFHVFKFTPLVHYFYFNLNLVRVPPSKLLLLMSFLHFFCSCKSWVFYALRLKVRWWEWWHF